MLGHGERGVAAPPGALGMGPTAGKVERDEALPSAHDAQEQDTIAAGPGALQLPAVPRANAPELFPVCAEHGRIDAPSPWPATWGGGALSLGVAPNGEANRQPHASQACKPGACGPSTQQPGGDSFVPSADARAFMAMSASKERGQPEADDCAQQLLLGLHAACNLGDQRIGTIQGFESLMDRRDRGLGLGTLVLEAFLGLEATALSGLGWFGGVSFHGGHGALLRTVGGILLGSKETRAHLRRIWRTVC